jgi:PAS domain S-box-containing protein
MGWTWRALIHPLDRARTERAWRAALEHGVAYEHEYRLRRRDGAYRWILSRATPARDERGRVCKWYGADTDVHELHEARDALRLNEARFRVTLSNPDFVVWTQDTNLRYTWMHNPPPGYEAVNSLGQTDRELIVPKANGERLHRLKQRVLESGEDFAGEVSLTISGEVRHYEMRLHSFTNAEGEVVGLAGAAYDISARLRAEEELHRAQRFESIAVLAGGVAHDFNNLLTAVIANTSFVLSALPAQVPASLRGLLEGVVKAGESAAVLTRQLLAYAGKGRFRVAPLNLAELIESLAPLLRASLPRALRLELELEEDLPWIEADAQQVQQMVTNLVINAAEAIGERAGRVCLRVHARELAEADLQALGLAQGRPGTYLELQVEDDGPGMDAATLERAFEPFFSTKFKGRGLGLSAAQGIVRGHHGAIRASSHEGQGTRVLVYLPPMDTANAAPPAVERRSSAAAPAPAPSTGTVLFVDDEAPLREIAKLSLERAGYRVLLAEHGAAALELVRRGAQIDAIVLDMTMPVLDGVETAARLREMQVAAPIIASSGYSETEILARFNAWSPLVLRKPYRPAELVEKVRAALGGDTSAASPG